MKGRWIIAATAGGTLASASFGGFSVFATLGSTANGFDRYDIVAINTGGATGTQIKGLEYFYRGRPAAFQVDDLDEDGTPDTVNLLSPSRTRIRVSTSGANNMFVGVSPSNEFAQPNPYAGGVTAFQGAIANIGTTQASGTGFQIARIFLPVGGWGNFSGNIGGDVGSKVPFSLYFPPGDPPGPPVIVNDGASTNAVFGSIVSAGAPFSIVIHGTGPDAAQLLSLSVGTLPAGVSNVTVTPQAAISPASFTVTGTVDYSLNGRMVIIPMTLSDSSGLTDVGFFSITVTPEPGSVWALGLLGGLGCRTRTRNGRQP